MNSTLCSVFFTTLRFYFIAILKNVHIAMKGQKFANVLLTTYFEFNIFCMLSKLKSAEREEDHISHNKFYPNVV